ncbi:MAG TPA: ABC transporter permease, partial [Rubellimicrobium sp.]|nr:ABC transporter permease [Rubellimicrobium sp.]
MSTETADTLRIGSAPPQAATGRAMALGKRRVPLAHRLWAGNAGPVLVVVLAIVALWYGAAVLANWRGVSDAFERAGEQRSQVEIMVGTMAQERPVLPAPHQIAVDLFDSVFGWPLDSPRNLLFHAAVTSSATLLGFAMGTALG